MKGVVELVKGVVELVKSVVMLEALCHTLCRITLCSMQQLVHAPCVPSSAPWIFLTTSPRL